MCIPRQVLYTSELSIHVKNKSYHFPYCKELQCVRLPVKNLSTKNNCSQLCQYIWTTWELMKNQSGLHLWRFWFNSPWAELVLMFLRDLNHFFFSLLTTFVAGPNFILKSQKSWLCVREAASLTADIGLLILQISDQVTPTAFKW